VFSLIETVSQKPYLQFPQAPRLERFGSKNLALNFSIATCGIIVSSTAGPTLAGWIRTSTGSYFLVLIAMLGLAAFMFVMAFALRQCERNDKTNK